MGKQAATARRARQGARERRQPARRARATAEPGRIRFGRRSLLLFAAGAASIAVGYVLLAAGSVTAAPLLLVSGYCVFFPMGILLSEGLSGRGKGE